MHARQLEALHAANLWEKFVNRKRHLVEINEEEASNVGQPPFPLWDFTGYNQYCTEAVPDHGDTSTEMNWYWEASHFHK